VQKIWIKKFVSFFSWVGRPPAEGRRNTGHFIKGAFPPGTNLFFRGYFNYLNVLKFKIVVNCDLKE
jgi:hypothetical protein